MAVLNFHRLPTLAVAVCRRGYGVPTAAYYVDKIVVEIEAARGYGQRSFHMVHGAFGA